MSQDSATMWRMKERFNCSICLDTYTDPKQLQCHHIYCKKCLVRLMVRNQWHQLVLPCPNCRQVTPVPANGVAGLQSAFQIKHFLKMVDEHKRTGSGGRQTVSPSLKVSCCSTHPGRELELYCETCSVLICCRCALNGGQHCNHDYKEPKEAFESFAKEITSAVVLMENNLESGNMMVSELEWRRKEVAKQRSVIEVEIFETAKQIKKRIDTEARHLNSQLHQISKQKLKDISAQLCKVNATQTVISGNLDSLKKVLASKNYIEALKSRASTIKKSQQAVASFEQQPVEADVMFLSSSNTCESFGQLLQCQASGEGLHTGVVGKESVITVSASALGHHRAACDLDSLECELVPESAVGQYGARGTTVRRSGNKISFTPASEGRHQLHIRVRGQHICGSPFKVEVRAPQSEVAGRGQVLAEVERRDSGSVLLMSEDSEWNLEGGEFRERRLLVPQVVLEDDFEEEEGERCYDLEEMDY